LQDGRDSDCGEEWTMCVQTATSCVEPPNDVGLEMAISKLKNGKAPRFDQVPGEMIKDGGKELKNVTYERIKKN
jgi:hypothetical protein